MGWNLDLDNATHTLTLSGPGPNGTTVQRSLPTVEQNDPETLGTDMASLADMIYDVFRKVEAYPHEQAINFRGGPWTATLTNNETGHSQVVACFESMAILCMAAAMFQKHLADNYLVEPVPQPNVTC